MKKTNSNRFRATVFFLLALFLAFTGCNDDDAPGDARTGWVRILPLKLDFSAAGGTQEVFLVLTADVDTAAIECDVAPAGLDWCSVERSGHLLKVTAEPTYYRQPRATVVTIRYGALKRELPVSQEASSGADDLLIPVVSATATSQETEAEDRGIEKSYDGDYESYFNSKFGAITEWPFVIDYTLESGHTLNYIVYRPRTDAGNKWGSFNRFTVSVATADNPAEFVKVGEYERGDANHTVFRMSLETPVENAKKVRFEIHSAYNNRISCAEMEFFQTSVNKYDYSRIFADPACSELKAGVTEADIRKIPDADYKQLAAALLNGAYNTEFRVADYRPYQNPAIMAAANKTSKYSQRDNPTGIYAEDGEEMLVLVGPAKGRNLSMVVQDLGVGYGSSKVYPLTEGGNRIKVSGGGLIYIMNQTDELLPLNPETDAEREAVAAKTVKIHFAFGKVNGYFNSAVHTADDWKTLLRNARYKDIDALGRYAHITWKVQDFRDYDTDIVGELEKFDRLVYLEQDFMGLVKYGKMMNNRMYFHIDYNGASPYASDYRTAYTPGYAEVFCNVDRFEARIWGPAHEVGHCNQTRPGLKWAGTTEVTNNIFSMYVQQQFGQPSKLLVDGTYAAAKAAIIDAGQPHCLNNGSSEFMLKLVPFWQLKLYLVDVLGQSDFYKDLFEHYRITPNLDTSVATDGALQLDFVRQACRVSGLNLLDFFSKWGFLTPVDRTFSDYGNKRICITQQQVDALTREIEAAGYALPPAGLHLITEDNLDQYK